MIPRMYGTVRFDINPPDDTADPQKFTHPVLDSVSGLALEYIEGVSLQYFTVGVNITEDEADRVSQGTLSAMCELRRLRVCHDDIRLPNIMVRNGDFDNPVIIDLAFASIKPPEMSDTEWSMILPHAQVALMRRVLGDAGFHMPSPYASRLREDPMTGFSELNGIATNMRSDWRNRLFEPIAQVVGSEIIKFDEYGTKFTWRPPRWRIKPGIRLAPESDPDRV